MNSSQIHLALTHVPVILSFVGLVTLVIAWIGKNEILTKTSFYILLAAGLFTLPVYFTGEGAEEIVEELPGVSESIIERHEEIAQIALIVIGVTGVIALTGLVFGKQQRLARAIKLTALLFAIGSAAAMAQTAHLGGQIRHSEIRSGFLAQSENGDATESENEDGEENENSGTKEFLPKDSISQKIQMSSGASKKEKEDDDD